MNSDNRNEEDENEPILDSYFLPGGILDPSDSEDDDNPTATTTTTTTINNKNIWDVSGSRPPLYDGRGGGTMDLVHGGDFSNDAHRLDATILSSVSATPRVVFSSSLSPSSSQPDPLPLPPLGFQRDAARTNLPGLSYSTLLSAAAADDDNGGGGEETISTITLNCIDGTTRPLSSLLSTRSILIGGTDDGVNEHSNGLQIINNSNWETPPVLGLLNFQGRKQTIGDENVNDGHNYDDDDDDDEEEIAVVSFRRHDTNDIVNETTATTTTLSSRRNTQPAPIGSEREWKLREQKGRSVIDTSSARTTTAPLGLDGQMKKSNAAVSATTTSNSAGKQQEGTRKSDVFNSFFFLGRDHSSSTLIIDDSLLSCQDENVVGADLNKSLQDFMPTHDIYEKSKPIHDDDDGDDDDDDDNEDNDDDSTNQLIEDEDDYYYHDESDRLKNDVWNYEGQNKKDHGIMGRTTNNAVKSGRAITEEFLEEDQREAEGSLSDQNDDDDDDDDDNDDGVGVTDTLLDSTEWQESLQSKGANKGNVGFGLSLEMQKKQSLREVNAKAAPSNGKTTTTQNKLEVSQLKRTARESPLTLEPSCVEGDHKKILHRDNNIKTKDKERERTWQQQERMDESGSKTREENDESHPIKRRRRRRGRNIRINDDATAKDEPTTESNEKCKQNINRSETLWRRNRNRSHRTSATDRARNAVIAFKRKVQSFFRKRSSKICPVTSAATPLIDPIKEPLGEQTKSTQRCFKSPRGVFIAASLKSLLSLWKLSPSRFVPGWKKSSFKKTIMKIITLHMSGLTKKLILLAKAPIKATQILIAFIVLLHKHALVETVENDTACICFVFAISYPKIISLVCEFITVPYWVPQVLWYCCLFCLCRPQQSVKRPLVWQEEEARNHEAALIMARVAGGGEDGARAKKEAARIAMKEPVRDKSCVVDTKEVEQVLRVVRFMLPFFLLAEGFSSGQGMIMESSQSVRVSIGFMLSAFRLGYVFSPVVWLSWAVQVLAVRYLRQHLILEHFMMVFGLSTIRFVNFLHSLEHPRSSNDAENEKRMPS